MLTKVIGLDKKDRGEGRRIARRSEESCVSRGDRRNVHGTEPWLAVERGGPRVSHPLVKKIEDVSKLP